MPPPTLPLETIEQVIGVLRGDAKSLAACSLTCHALLPISRVHLWHVIALTVNSPDGSYSARTRAFLGILARSPAIAPYVRSLVLLPQMRQPPRDPDVYLNTVNWGGLSARLPALRSLRLYAFLVSSLYEVVSLVRECPTLEALYLNQSCMVLAHAIPAWPIAPAELAVTPVGGQPPASALRTLSIVGGLIVSEELSRLSLFLARASAYMHLESLEFSCAAMARGGSAPPPGIPSFGASLRHFGTTLVDVADRGISPEGRAHMWSVISGLPRCSALRSLHLEYDRRIAFLLSAVQAKAFGTPLAYTPTPFFLELLADVLSAPGPTPLPLLETITLVFISPVSWLAGFEAAFSHLAEALVGDADGSGGTLQPEGAARRYPRFSRLEVQIDSLETLSLCLGDEKRDEKPRKLAAERDSLVQPMLARFVRAGVQVEVTCVQV